MCLVIYKLEHVVIVHLDKEVRAKIWKRTQRQLSAEDWDMRQAGCGDDEEEVDEKKKKTNKKNMLAHIGTTHGPETIMYNTRAPPPTKSNWTLFFLLLSSCLALAIGRMVPVSVKCMMAYNIRRPWYRVFGSLLPIGPAK